MQSERLAAGDRHYNGSNKEKNAKIEGHGLVESNPVTYSYLEGSGFKYRPKFQLN